MYICNSNTNKGNKIKTIMDIQKRESIKNNIKKVVSSNPDKSIVLVFGILNTTLTYTSKRDFGNKVLDFLNRDNVNDITYEGIENNALKFEVSQDFNHDSFGNNRGYGRGRYMGD